MAKYKIPEEGIYDARPLGKGRMFLLGFQHMFAMFGATVSSRFHLITGGKVPAFLGSSFAFLGGYAAVKAMPQFADGTMNWIPYAGVGVAVAGLIYVVVAGLFKIFGAQKVMRFFPPIVTGPIIICIGMILANSAINNWLPIHMERTVIGLFMRDNLDGHLLLTSVITIVPLSLATMVEHIGDVSAISSTCNRNYIENPGLHRTLMGDGLATSLAALFGAPANTTYGENTGVLASARSTTRASSASRQSLPCASPSARSSRLSAPPGPVAPSAASAWSSTV